MPDLPLPPALWAAVHGLAESTAGVWLLLTILGAVFTAVSLVARPCNPGQPWWRKPDVLTDVCYWFAIPVVSGYARVWLLVIGIVVMNAACASAGLPAQFGEGKGPLAGLPFWAQVPLYLILSDLVMYATHRLFHTMRLWRFHAVHHSSEQVEWVSAARFHPVDAVFHGALSDAVPLLLGISPDVVIALVPFSVALAALAHANLDWTFGPLRYLLVSPVFHRWHHTGPDQGGNMNFAASFPFIDLIFGTFYMPKGVLPEAYGNGDPSFPSGFGGQLVHPFVGAGAGGAAEGAGLGR
ncbi:fatty acid hydroxylase [Methylobacterium sp. 4-46]|uniref:sterol desaturase family protein n=1 Tax=unclassified Methylobacterium TaxID=2615210 RepID=UPI000152BDD8|nr:MULTISPECIES: sterol desaturase family protein [Methylobacterium]ACA16137.1 fatty acid hydroxylase [Methylobacterium sp. 4-46]WFT81846.1 sterol desaturase family protein [Methylobacterium nodulans]